ncbi:MFS transporter [Microbacterium sp. NPDC077663]|uniref:MFS transporter n=1 Tax=Microbacterium sp. NPDC077663 TaxID=3364189 RepID=UPI0037C66AE6
MASYIDAAAIISFSIVLTIYAAVFQFTPEEVGLGAGAIAFGIAIGALIGGRLGDRFGRRPVFVATMVIIIVGLLVMMFSTTFPVLAIGVLLLGLGAGADLPVSLSTIAEAANDENRGRLISFSNILWIGGVLISMIGGTLFGNLGVLGAQILLGHVAVVAVLVLLGRLTIPESDAWRESRAERAAGVATIRADNSSIRQLFSRRYVVPFLGLILFYALVNLAANTGGQFGTYLLVNEAGVDVSTASLLGLVSFPVILIGYGWFMKIADKPYRFNYFVVGALLYVAAQLVPAIFGYSVATMLISGVVGSIGAAFAFETIMKVWTQEQFPTLLRSTAQGTIIAVARFSAAGLATFTPLILAAGVSVLYWFLAIVSAVGFLIAYFVFRTRDQHNEFDVEEQLDPEAVDDAPSVQSR